MDLKAELNNFKPINLDGIIREGETIPDNIRNSIILYNKAIESLRSGSEDIAIIELRKATSMNPHFNEALNLLGVCYGYVGEKEKAAEVFERVLKAESNSVQALKYMKKLGLGEPEKPTGETPVRKPSVPSQQEPLKRIRSKNAAKTGDMARKQLLVDAVKMGAGFAVGFLLAAVIFVSLPKESPVPSEPDTTAIEEAVSEAKAEYEAKYNELKNKYDLLQQDKENAIKQADYYKSALKLYEIESLYRDRKYQEAADMLLLMKTVEFKDEEKNKFDALYETVMPLAAKSSYDDGYRLYNRRKYQEALKSFEKVQVYDSNFSKMDALLYYMGRCCQYLQDSRSAVAFFQKLMDEYPKSTYARSAKVRINELTKIP